MTPPLWQKVRGTKKSLDESEKIGLKQHLENQDHGNWSHHVTSNRWGNNGYSGWLYCGGLQNHFIGDSSLKFKRRLLLGRKFMTNLDSILKSRDVTLPTKTHLIRAMVFQVVRYGCESWNIKTAECRRIDAFELCCWTRFLRVPWTARRSNQSILKEIRSEYSLEGLMLKLTFQYFDHLIGRNDSLGKTTMLRKIEGRRRRGW